MVGFAEPNRYEPRTDWRETLAQWVGKLPGAKGTWQHQIGLYWRWRTLKGLSLSKAWRELRMEPAVARAALAPSPDSGLIPPELFGHLLARSGAISINPESNITDVIITPTPPGGLPDRPEEGFTPPSASPPRPALYQPRMGWKGKLRGVPLNSPGWLAELRVYWRRRSEDRMSVEDAWALVNLDSNLAGMALERNNTDRGAIPPELISRVVMRSGMSNITSEDIAGIIVYPEQAE